MLAIADSAVEMLFLGVSNLASVTGFSLHSRLVWLKIK